MRLDRNNLGPAYFFAFAFCIVGLLTGSIIFQIGGVVLMIWAFASDNDDDNHIDPPGTEYVHNGPVQEQI